MNLKVLLILSIILNLSYVVVSVELRSASLIEEKNMESTSVSKNLNKNPNTKGLCKYGIGLGIFLSRVPNTSSIPVPALRPITATLQPLTLAKTPPHLSQSLNNLSNGHHPLSPTTLFNIDPTSSGPLSDMDMGDVSELVTPSLGENDNLTELGYLFISTLISDFSIHHAAISATIQKHLTATMKKSLFNSKKNENAVDVEISPADLASTPELFPKITFKESQHEEANSDKIRLNISWKNIENFLQIRARSDEEEVLVTNLSLDVDVVLAETEDKSGYRVYLEKLPTSNDINVDVSNHDDKKLKKSLMKGFLNLFKDEIGLYRDADGYLTHYGLSLDNFAKRGAATSSMNPSDHPLLISKVLHGTLLSPDTLKAIPSLLEEAFKNQPISKLVNSFKVSKFNNPSCDTNEMPVLELVKVVNDNEAKWKLSMATTSSLDLEIQIRGLGTLFPAFVTISNPRINADIHTKVSDGNKLSLSFLKKPSSMITFDLHGKDGKTILFPKRKILESVVSNVIDNLLQGFTSPSSNKLQWLDSNLITRVHNYIRVVYRGESPLVVAKKSFSYDPSSNVLKLDSSVNEADSITIGSSDDDVSSNTDAEVEQVDDIAVPADSNYRMLQDGIIPVLDPIMLSKYASLFKEFAVEFLKNCEIPDLEKSQFGFKMVMTKTLCKNLQIEEVTFNQVENSNKIQISIKNASIECAGNYAYQWKKLINGKGTMEAVYHNSNIDLEGELTINEDGKLQATPGSCKADIGIKSMIVKGDKGDLIKRNLTPKEVSSNFEKFVPTVFSGVNRFLKDIPIDDKASSTSSSSSTNSRISSIQTPSRSGVFKNLFLRKQEQQKD